MTFDPVAKKLGQRQVHYPRTRSRQPIFDPSLNFTQGGVNPRHHAVHRRLPAGEFLEARSSPRAKYHVAFWGSQPFWAEQSIRRCPRVKGMVITNPFGAGKVGTYDITCLRRENCRGS